MEGRFWLVIDKTVTNKKIIDFRLELFDRPPYSSYLAPSHHNIIFLQFKWWLALSWTRTSRPPLRLSSHARNLYAEGMKKKKLNTF